MRPSVCRACATKPACTVGRISASVAHALAGVAPAAPHHSLRQQSNCQVVNYEMDPRDAALWCGSSGEISLKDGEVTPALAADVPAFGPAHAGSVTAYHGSRRRPAWVPAGHDLLDPNFLGPTEAEGVVLRSDMAELIVRQGPMVPCICCLERWLLDPTKSCRPVHPGLLACQKCSEHHQGCVLVRSPSSYYCWVC